MDEATIRREKVKNVLNKLDSLLEVMKKTKKPHRSNDGRFVNLKHRIKNVEKIKKQVIEQEKLTEENIIFLNIVWEIYKPDEE